jgi:hypothetical protein
MKENVLLTITQMGLGPHAVQRILNKL